MSREEDREEEECVIMCCPEEGAEIGKKIREKVLVELGEKLEGRGNVVMTRLNDEDLKQIDALVGVKPSKADLKPQPSLLKKESKHEKTFFRKSCQQ